MLVGTETTTTLQHLGVAPPILLGALRGFPHTHALLGSQLKTQGGALHILQNILSVQLSPLPAVP